MIDEHGKVNQNALQMKITDNYLDTISRVYKEVKIVGLPSSSGGGSGSGDPLSAENIATALALYKHVTGKDLGNGELSAGDIHTIQSQIGNLKSGLDEMNKKGTGSGASKDGDRVRYLDSQTLY